MASMGAYYINSEHYIQPFPIKLTPIQFDWHLLFMMDCPGIPIKTFSGFNENKFSSPVRDWTSFKRKELLSAVPLGTVLLSVPLPRPNFWYVLPSYPLKPGYTFPLKSEADEMPTPILKIDKITSLLPWWINCCVIFCHDFWLAKIPAKWKGSFIITRGQNSWLI